MDNLVRHIREKEEELWLLYLTLQELKVKDSRLFQQQDFSKIRDSCSGILSLIGEAEDGRGLR
jgi:hypothetical protein